MTTVLVTGGAGFIGTHLVNRLVKEKYDVTVLDNFHHGQNAKELPYKKEANVIEGDITDVSLVDSVTKGIDVIFHLAAISNIKESIQNPHECFQTNTLGTFNILHAALKNNVEKIIFSSSREVYGNAARFPVKEEEPLSPVNIYGATKASAEHFCNVFRKENNLKITIFRLSNVYGPHDMGKSRVVPAFMRKIKENHPLTINGGNQILDFVWIDDVINVFMKSIQDYDNQTLNIGSGKGTSINELAQLMIEISGKEIGIIHNPTIPQEVEKYVADISKIAITSLPLKEGLKILFEFSEISHS